MSTRGKALTSTAVIATIALFVCSLLFAVESVIRNSKIYEIALIEAGHSPCVATRVGTPFKPGWLVAGNMQESDTVGSAHLEIPVKGIKGKGSIFVSAEKQNGIWRIDELLLVQEGKETRITPDSSPAACE